jgi:hypothetical protein
MRERAASHQALPVVSKVFKNSLFCRLFKNAQMQGAQKPKSEAYMEIRRAMRFAAQRSR